MSLPEKMTALDRTVPYSSKNKKQGSPRNEEGRKKEPSKGKGVSSIQTIMSAKEEGNIDQRPTQGTSD